MGDPADVGLVDPHAEGDGGHDDQPVLGRETALRPAGAGRARSRRDRRRRRGRRPTGPSPASRSWRGSRSRRSRTARAARRRRTGSARAGCPWAQRRGGCSAGRTRAGRCGASLPSKRRATISSRVSASAVAVKAASGTPSARRSFADLEVVGAEVVAPLADAMRLVHGDQADACPAEKRQGARRREAFGRHVEKLEFPRVRSPRARCRSRRPCWPRSARPADTPTD